MTVCRKRRRNCIQGDDSAGIREARFAFPHYCHASNYTPSKATVRRAKEMGGWMHERTKGAGAVGRVACCRCATGSVGVSRALRDSQPTGETRANKSPQLPPVRAICLDWRLMPDIIHPGNNTLLPNEV